MSDIVLDWIGQSGRKYRYWLLKRTIAEDIKDEAGNYVFVNQLPNGDFIPLYFGAADSLQKRIPNHERWADAIRMGAIGIMAHISRAGATALLAEEEDLIAYWDPPLNLPYRPAL